MLKSISVAALLGFGLGFDVSTFSGWTESGSLIDEDWLSLNWYVNLDSGRGTHWVN